MNRLIIAVSVTVALSFAACDGGTDDPFDDLGFVDNVLLDVLVDTGADVGSPTDEGRDLGVEPDNGQTDDLGNDVQAPEDLVVDVQDVLVNDQGDETIVGCIEGSPCDDENLCTYGEKCSADGVCAGGTTYVCNDGRDCTDDACDGKGNCLSVIGVGKCLINNVCRNEGDARETDPCEICAPEDSAIAWSSALNGTACDPSGTLAKCQDAPSGSCVDGACVADLVVPKSCDDANPCTEDACDSELGCVFLKVSWVKCILDDHCKPGYCNQGICVVLPDASCDDDNQCTSDSCEEGVGCKNESLDQVICDDGDACTYEDACTEGVCGGLEQNCDDGNICTLDACDNIIGCYHDLATNPCCDGGVSRCDDNNPCTTDDCDPDTFECLYSDNQAACNDNNACTVGDSCEEGECIGFSKNCNDGNQCSRDYCDGGKCFNEILNGTVCDDGIGCSTGDHCETGVCVADMSGCTCTPVFSSAVTKFVTMVIPDDGQAGSGLDLDQDPATCAPESDCCCGVNNSMGPLAGLPVANDSITDAILDGSLIILFEHRDLKTNGEPYTLAFYAGELDPTNPTCDYQTADCPYLVDGSLVDEETCEPVAVIDNAKIVNGKLTAGGKAYIFPFDLPLFEGINLHVDLFFATIEANVTVAGGKVTSMVGTLGGAVPKQQISDALAAIPDDEWPDSIPFDKATVATLLDMLVIPDIDGDDDGELESASISIKFSAIPGTITGLK